MKISNAMGYYNPFWRSVGKADFSELRKLAKMLSEGGIPYRHYTERPNVAFQMDFFEQIEYLDDHGEKVSDAIVIYAPDGHPMSYGAPLLEIMGLTENGDEVEGGLTAEEVFKRWKNDFQKRKGAKE